MTLQIFIQCGKSDFPEQEERAVLDKHMECKTKEEEFAQLNEFPRFV